jgi:PAS domain-containing protein
MKSASKTIVHGSEQAPTNLASIAGSQTPTDLAQALAVLRVNTAEILEHKKQLEELNGWFEVALDNMARGLSMFDAQQRLIVCNKMYREIYKLPAELAQPGTPLAEIVRFHVKRETGSDCPGCGETAQMDRTARAELARGDLLLCPGLRTARHPVTNQPLAREVGGPQEDIARSGAQSSK